MSAEEYRTNPGRFDGRTVTSGTESFDIKAIYDAVQMVERRVGQALVDRLELGPAPMEIVDHPDGGREINVRIGPKYTDGLPF